MTDLEEEAYADGGFHARYDKDQKLAEVAGKMETMGYDARTLQVLVDHLLGGEEIPEPEVIRELLCQMCGRDYPVWYADNDLWNEVMREGDQGNVDDFEFVCPTCFMLKAMFMGVTPIFRVSRSRTESQPGDAK